MSAPIRVAVVRPKKSGVEAVGYFLGAVGGVFLAAWPLMLIIGTVTDWSLSYWHTVLVIYGLRVLQAGSGWRMWTHQEKGSWL